jgi:hypothetical protein
MLTFFVIIASFEAVDEPSLQFATWRMASREQCERRLHDLLFNFNISFDMKYDRESEQRVFTSEKIAKYQYRKTRLSCVEVAPYE